jgi:hypothetical protein
MRAALFAFVALGLMMGCSDSSAPKPPPKLSSVLPGSKDKDGKDGPTPTKSDDKAVQFLEDAIKVHGGMDALGKLASIERNVKGTFAAERRNLDFTADASFQLPGKMRTVISIDTGDSKAGNTVVLDGDKGWQTDGGESITLPDSRVQELREQLYAYAVTTLLPLRDSSVILVMADETPVDGKPASVLRAVAKDQPEMRLYFDKASGLLVKVSYRAKLAGGSGDMEIRLLDHKDIDGAKVPQRQIESLNGNKVADWTLTSIRPGRKFDANTFARP